MRRAPGQARGTIPWRASGRFPELLAWLAAECHHGREDPGKFKTLLSFQILHLLKRDLW